MNRIILISTYIVITFFSNYLMGQNPIYNREHIRNTEAIILIDKTKQLRLNIVDVDFMKPDWISKVEISNDKIYRSNPKNTDKLLLIYPKEEFKKIIERKYNKKLRRGKLTQNQDTKKQEEKVLIPAAPLVNGKPIKDLIINEPPTMEEARKLNYSKGLEVYLDSNNQIKYRDYAFERAKGTELAFTLAANKSDRYSFDGKQVNLKIKDGWLIGFDGGEWGGTLFWFNEDGTEYKRVAGGNIKNLFEIDGKIYFTSGLAHLGLSYGNISQIEKVGDEWIVDKKVELPHAPSTATLTKDNEFLIVTSEGLIKVNENFEIETLVEKGFWRIYLYSNSMITKDQYFYIGMRGGILKVQLDDISNQEWLTEE